MTLLFLTSVVDRPTLLQILIDSMLEEHDRVLDFEALAEVEEPDDADVLDLVAEEDFGDEEADEADFDPDTQFALPGPPAHGEPFDLHTPMRTTPTGAESLYVAAVLADWLRRAPDGPLELGTVESGFAIACLVLGWGSGVVHALAAGPLSLPELNAALPELPYRVIEERMSATERTGMAETVTGADGRRRYAATRWLREGIAPIAASARFELHHPQDDMAAPDGADVEAAFRLALPLLPLPPEPAGACRLTARLEDGGRAGVLASLGEGRVLSCSADLEQDAEAWASAPPVDWLDTLVDPARARIRTGGDERLTEPLLQGLHERLFAVPEYS